MLTTPLSLRLTRLASAPVEAQSGSTAQAPAEQVDTFTGASVHAVKAKAKTKFKDNDWTKLSGTIMNREAVRGIGGEVPPAGSFLMLDKPITLNGKKVTEVHLTDTFKKGLNVVLNGRLNARKWGGVETKGGTYAELSGLSNLSKGEPAFNGKEFVDASGTKLQRLSYNRPLIMDAPAQIFVLDRKKGKAFIGAMGGFIPPWINSFHGFRASAAIKSATAADRAAVKEVGGRLVNAKSGKALELIGTSGGGNFPDAMSTSWYMDAESKKLYAFLNGGIAGFQNHMSEVVKLP